MKKSTYETIYSALTSFGFDNEEVLNELTKEINRGAEKKAANDATYNALHDVVVGNLEDKPCTCSELWDAIKDIVPDGVTKGKVLYALNNLWRDEIVTIPGSPKTYRRA